MAVIEDLATSYKKAVDDRKAVKTEEELDLIISDTNRDAATIKSYISDTMIKETRSKSVTASVTKPEDQ